MMLELMVDAKNALGECVLWCERSGRVFWTDILGATLWAHHPTSGVTRSWAMPERLASFALTDHDERLLVGLATQLAFFDLDSGALTPICEVEAGLTTRLNDGRCDRQGRFVFGTFNEVEPRLPIGGFYRLNRDLRLERLPLPHVAIANSICFSPDGTTMYYCDSPQQVIRCCDYDVVSGALSNQRVFAQVQGEGEPDGSCVDARGYLWNAQWGGGKLVRYAPDGSIDRSVALPASQPSCVAFGGALLDQLYATSARVGLASPGEADGGLFTGTVPGVRGLPESRFVC
ncbi:SMP-30/gluconolactonase/LRE family protein [Massilia sp. CCM 8693]|uniref:SMP-30/gluconolactonase/LRE family protein n=2 Tax=Massilia aquatica TaxID=2609000 RepID=A0ABX0M0T2_9BURK|nr:SMP-30/gluconolactonase/LRE family protein [Massilia aquatica]